MHRERTTVEVHEPHAEQVVGQRHGLRRSKAALTAATQVSSHPAEDVTVKTMEHATWMAVTEVRLPTPQGLVEPADQRRQRHPAPLGTGQRAYFVAQTGLGLPRRFHAQVAMAASEVVAFVPQRETEEVDARPPL